MSHIITRNYDLRPRPHNFQMPQKNDHNYFPRTLLRWQDHTDPQTKAMIFIAKPKWILLNQSIDFAG